MKNNKLESILSENRIFEPSSNFKNQANIKNCQELRDLAEKNYENFWANLAKQNINWHKEFSNILDESNAPFYRWFDDGQLNVSYNCLDRHLEDKAQKCALIFESDDGEVKKVTYQELYEQVCQFANGLKKSGIKKADRVIIYMPMSIEAVVAMQACARIGAIHSVVFAGFSAKSLNDRIIDTGACAVITADQGKRGGKVIELKKTVDEALNLTQNQVNKTIIYKRTGAQIDFNEKRDLWWDDITKNQEKSCEPEIMNSEDPLFILYTSGSTGKPKGIQHSSAGYLLGAILSMKWVFDHKSDDIFWCTADVGWITGHSYVAYGPLALGATQVIFEGTPTYPDAGRFWQLVERHKVSIFYTAPTAIRALIKLGSDLPKKYDLSSLRLLGTVGEPINPEAWIWYHEIIGNKKCPIVDTWWQTETGSHMIAPLPGSINTKPGSCTKPLPGIIADIIDEAGNIVDDPQNGGYLAIKRPFPSQIRTIYGDEKRFKETYFPDWCGGYYLAGDSAHKDQDGYFWIMGRIDDVLNVSGHRLGTMEVESALVANSKVAEAAVVGRPDDIKGEAICAFVILKNGEIADENTKNELRNWVASEIGAIAKPDDIRFGDNLPKTRSGKIMRRLLRQIARGEEITGDVSTLENPAILDSFKNA